ncbi:hypothetical protein ACQUSR_05535 [Streptomyces sp. P1-3]|uniref:hypothetical protein n=1 Tax=Streptomyces sp. P1-3 TaxID=3421658 RepID=UPI003D35FAB8
MRPHRSASARTAVAPVAALAGLVLAAVGLVGCAADTGARDGGAAPRLAPPTSASPLWPRYTPPVAPTKPEPSADVASYPPVKGVTVPAGGLRKLPVRTLLEHDFNVPEWVRGAARGDCPADCSLRDPVYRDLTGDGRDELVVAIDALGFRLTVLEVYQASGDTVRPVLIHWGPLGLTGETIGRDLVISSRGQEGQITTHLKWNGRVLAPVPPPEGPAGTPPDAQGTPGADSGADARTTP